MRVTWIIPDTYGFVIDELERLSSRLDGIRVLSEMPVSDEIRRRLPGVELHECPECSFVPSMLRIPSLRGLLHVHGWQRLLRNGWHVRRIAGIYKVLTRLERVAPSSVIHSHFAHPGGLGGTLLADVPHLLTLRGYDILTTGNYGSLWNPFYRANLIRSFAQGRIVTAGSTFSLQRARQILGPDADIRLLDEGLIPESFVAAGLHIRESLGLPPDAVVLLTVGNLVAVKNHRMLIDAFANVLTCSKRPVYLLVCGDGTLSGALRSQAADRGITDRVRFMGPLPRAELTDLLKLGDILVHSALSEGFGNVILEAMLHHLLVIASPVGIAPDVIRHRENGYLPMLGDKDSFAESLAEAIDRLPVMNSVLDANRDLVLARFSMERRIDGYLQIYQELSPARAMHS